MYQPQRLLLRGVGWGVWLPWALVFVSFHRHTSWGVSGYSWGAALEASVWLYLAQGWPVANFKKPDGK